MSDVPGLRERRRLETRAEINRAAIDLVLERGFAHVTVEDIAEAANVSPRTFFNYFATKKDALITGPPDFAPGALERFVEDRENSVFEGLRTLLVNYAEMALKRRQDMPRMHALVKANPDLAPLMRERFMAFETTIADAVARRLGIADGLEPRVAAATVTALFRTAATHWLSHSDSDKDADEEQDDEQHGEFEAVLNEAFSALRHVVDA